MEIKNYQIAILGIFIALGAVCSAYIISNAAVEYQKLQNQTIRVTGSASRKVTSDKASWRLEIKGTLPSLKEGYAKLNADTKKTIDFLVSNGIDENNIEIMPVNSWENYKRLPNGNNTNEIESYHVYRYIKVKSNDINILTDISKRADELINQDINLTSENIEYYVSNLDEIKVSMAAEAAKNAKQRAESLVSGTGSLIGAMTNAKMGVFQIVPADSTEVSDYGINDTTSIEKKVVSTVSAAFTVK